MLEVAPDDLQWEKGKLRISPDAGAPGAKPHEPGTVTVHNPCLSGGALDIFLEPFLPSAVVVVHGDAPIASAVRELAGWLGFDLRPWEDGGAAGTTAVVPAGTAAVIVASHGGAEHAVIRAALHAGVPYIGLIASTRRGEAVAAASTAVRTLTDNPVRLSILGVLWS